MFGGPPLSVSTPEFWRRRYYVLSVPYPSNQPKRGRQHRLAELVTIRRSGGLSPEGEKDGRNEWLPSEVSARNLRIPIQNPAGREGHSASLPVVQLLGRCLLVQHSPSQRSTPGLSIESGCDCQRPGQDG